VGILNDYFRAPDAASAARVAELPAGPCGPRDYDAQPTFDGIEAKGGVDPSVVLGQLVALIRGVRWTPELASTEWVWPPEEQLPDVALSPTSEEEPAVEGAWVEELGVEVRDTLASVEDARLPELAARWAQIEEFPRYTDTASAALELATDLIALARRARAAGDRLYCWTCL
jgi:hypothetical protein